MRKEKQTILRIALPLLLVLLAACSAADAPAERQEAPPAPAAVEIPLAPPEEAPPAPQPAEPSDAAPQAHAYISITYGRDNPENFTGREIVFYTYDLMTQALEEVCVLPYDAKYASGVVSWENQTVYYSRRAKEADLSSADCLFAYDLQTGESTMLEQENWSYNEITLLDSDTLLVMAVTAQHPIMPALFDLRSRTFTYLADVNDEPFRLYTSGPAPLGYNYQFGRFVYIFQTEEDRYDEEYMSFEKAVDTHIALVPTDLKKDPAMIYTVCWPVNREILGGTQISENELLLRTYETDVSGFSTTSEIGYYSLVFDGDQSTLTPCDPPYPNTETANVGRCITLDRGESYYMYLTQAYGPSGLFHYRPATRELTPILLDDDSVAGHTVNFQIVGPQ